MSQGFFSPTSVPHKQKAPQFWRYSITIGGWWSYLLSGTKVTVILLVTNTLHNLQLDEGHQTDEVNACHLQQHDDQQFLAKH